MGNISDRKQLKKIFSYIGKELPLINEDFHPGKSIEYKKLYSTHIEPAIQDCNYFLNLFEKNYNTKPFDEFLLFTSKFCFENFLKSNNPEALKALGLFFQKHEEKIKPKYYITLTDEYIKHYNKKPELSILFDFFDIEKFNKQYLSCLCIATKNEKTLKKISENDNFSQIEYVYALIYESDFVISQFKKEHQFYYGKEIESLFLLQLERLDSKNNHKYLTEFINNIEDLRKLRELVFNHKEDRHLKREEFSIIDAVLIDEMVENMLQDIDNYKIFLNLNIS